MKHKIYPNLAGMISSSLAEDKYSQPFCLILKHQHQSTLWYIRPWLLHAQSSIS